jgi:hypothetical protein
MKNNLIYICWVLSLVAVFLFTKIHCCSKCNEIVKSDTVWVSNPPKTFTDTAPKSVASIAAKPYYKKKKIKGVFEINVVHDSPADSDGFVFSGVDSTDCDSIRTYINHYSDSLVDIKNTSQVHGTMLHNEIIYTLKYPVITNTVVNVIPRKTVIYGLVSARYLTFPVLTIGGGVIYKRYVFEYQYGIDKSHQVGIGVRVW